MDYDPRPGINPTLAAMKAEKEQLQQQLSAEIARLQQAKRMAGKIADARSKENAELRNASLIMEGELRDQIRQMRAALQTIVGMCLAPDREGHGIGKMHAIACRALEHPDWNSFELGTDEQDGHGNGK